MELRHRVLQFNNSPKINALKSELQKIGYKYKFNENGKLSSIESTFLDSEPHASELIEFAIQNEIILQSALYYTEEEIINAEWSLAEVGESQYPQPEDNYIDATYDTENYCYRCGQGKKQNRPFRLKRNFVQKQAKFLGLHWVFDEIFIRPEIKNIFSVAGISGINYLDVVYHKTNQPINNLLQMNISVLEEKALITEKLFPITCKPQNEESFSKIIGKIDDKPGLPYCGRVKYHYPLTEPIQFKAKVLQESPDIVKSFEYFGSGPAANHFILVRQKVVRLIKEKHISGMKFRRPVQLI